MNWMIWVFLLTLTWSGTVVYVAVPLLLRWQWKRGQKRSHPK